MPTLPSQWSKVMEKRTQQRLETLWSTENKDALNKVVMAEDDLGVRLNAGRPGARLAPKAIACILKKMLPDPQLINEGLDISHFCPSTKRTSLDEGQLQQTQLLEKQLGDNKIKSLLHLGGGHDHVYPFLKSLAKKYQKNGLLVINIDAHLDTRTDPFAHSGTPFRQFANETQIPFHLIQVGIHPYANPQENYHPLKNGQMDIWPGLEKEKLIEWIEAVRKQGPCPNAQVLLSLDADGLDSQCMEAVSAVNHNGLKFDQALELVQWCKEKSEERYFGIYEYNPLYDNLSQKGARTLAALIHKFWMD